LACFVDTSTNYILFEVTHSIKCKDCFSKIFEDLLAFKEICGQSVRIGPLITDQVELTWVTLVARQPFRLSSYSEYCVIMPGDKIYVQ
jgi:hypothetical protein